MEEIVFFKLAMDPKKPSLSLPSSSHSPENVFVSNQPFFSMVLSTPFKKFQVHPLPPMLAGNIPPCTAKTTVFV
jgi:hypothetical protein